jgi:ParB-like chromosome segregation protein Spo0J
MHTKAFLSIPPPLCPFALIFLEIPGIAGYNAESGLIIPRLYSAPVPGLMTLTPLIREISLSTVHLDAHPFCLVRSEEVARLGESLAAVGLLNLPRVQAGENGGWRPVTGWKRLMAAARLGWPAIPAVVLDRETPEAHLLLLYLHDNAFTRAFNPLEQALLASRLLDHWDRDTLVATGLPLLGLPSSPAHLDRLLAAASLERPWQELVAEGRLALTAAARLAAWDPAPRRAALPFLSTLPLSQSKQEEFVAGVEILARRQGLKVADVLGKKELQQHLEDEAGNARERAEAVRRLLSEWVSPRFSAAHKAFAAGLERLGLKRHPRLRLTEPPAFEGPDFELTLRFTDHRELRELLQELSRLAGLPEFEALIDL